MNTGFTCGKATHGTMDHDSPPPPSASQLANGGTKEEEDGGNIGYTGH